MSDTLMAKMLGLPEFEVTDFKQNDNDMGFYVETMIYVLSPFLRMCVPCFNHATLSFLYKHFGNIFLLVYSTNSFSGDFG